MYENYGNMLLQMKIQTHMVVHTSAFGVIHVAILWPGGSHNLRGSHVRYFLRREQRRQRRPLVAETRVIARNSPQSQRVSVNGLLVVLVVTVRKRCRSVEPGVVGGCGRSSNGVVPRWIRHWRCWSGTKAVVHEIVDMVGIRERASVDHRWLKVRAFGVLAFPFVGVLVAAEGLGGREVPAAVVTLEPATAFPVVISNGGDSSGGGIVFGSVEFEWVKVIVVGGVGNCFCGIRLVGWNSSVVSAAGEFYAEETNGWLLLDERSRADEGQLGEGVHVHEVVDFSVWGCCCWCCLVHKREIQKQRKRKGRRVWRCVCCVVLWWECRRRRRGWGGSYKQRESGDWSEDNWVWSISEWSLTRPQSLRVASPSQSTTFTPFHLILDPHGTLTSSIYTFCLLFFFFCNANYSITSST